MTYSFSNTDIILYGYSFDTTSTLYSSMQYYRKKEDVNNIIIITIQAL